MKILHISTSDISGGAARAAYRLHEAFGAAGLQSEMLVQVKESDDYRVFGPIGKIRKGLALLRPTLDQLPLRKYPSKTKTPFAPAWVPSSGLLRRVNESGADVVHLHWIAGGMLRIEDIAKIQKPIVWTLHDMWAFTGGCHYDENCGRYLDQCGTCPVLGSTQERDLSRRIYNKKLSVFADIGRASVNGDSSKKLQIVTPSSWLSECVKQSSLMGELPVHTIPYALNLKRFYPWDKIFSRAILGLPSDKKLICFGAIKGATDPRKGWKYLLEALSRVEGDKTDMNCVVFGQSQPKVEIEFGIHVHWMGHLNDDYSLALLYSAVDVMVVPSLQDNLPQTAVEAQACGCPVVAFDEGGLPDIVSHHQTGYLAAFKNSDDLAQGINWVLTGGGAELRENTRQRAVDLFDPDQIAKKYLEVFSAAGS